MQAGAGNFSAGDMQAAQVQAIQVQNGMVQALWRHVGLDVEGFKRHRKNIHALCNCAARQPVQQSRKVVSAASASHMCASPALQI